MSHVATGIVQRRQVGSPTRKAVLMFMAGCASDDGTGIWTSKQNMADDLEMGKRTVQVCIDDLMASGLISETGRRSCRNGFTVEYRINLDAVMALPSTRGSDLTGAGHAHVTCAGRAPVQDVHVTGAGRAPQDVQDVHPNHPRTIHEPSIDTDAGPGADEKPPVKARLPEDWALSDEGWAYARSQNIPDEVIEDEARGFHAYWSDRTDRDAKKSKRGWDATWEGWCRRIAARYRGVARKAAPFGHGRGGSIASIAARRRFEGQV